MKSNYAPPLFRILWRIGVHVRPPHFASFSANFLLTGAWFGVVWGALMWLLVWPGTGKSSLVAAITALVSGVSFGLCMALYYRHGARKYKLPEWSQIPQEKLVR
ncbi:hypothetical protein SAMN05518865_1252 [Duganella sp. CF458]|nr:hypothetical protein SAMN05518865_1252 [Duganella sp. CF458]